MSLSKCSCGAYCVESEEVQKEIDTCIEKGKPVRVICKCPVCGEKSITGGEPDFDDFSNKMCVMVFSEDYSENDKNLPMYESILLKECNKGEEEFSTYSWSKGKTIYLRKKKIYEQ